MSKPASAAEVTAIVRKVLGQASNRRSEDIDSDLRLRDLSIDSLGCHAICVVLEAELGVSLDPDALIGILARESSGDLIDRVMALRPSIQSDSGAPQ
jgi:acyl carrier protein